MLETYAFLAAFAIQILAMSVLYPAWFARYARAQATTVPAERLARLYPGIDHDRARERFLTLYRALHTGIAVLGLLLLGWLFNYLQRPHWDDGAVAASAMVYFMLQASPLALVAWLGFRFNKQLRSSLLDAKRKASLQRRGLFDFVSPYVIFVAGLAYILFAALVLYIKQQPFPGFAGLVNVGAVTLVYALNAVVVYRAVYGRKANPFESDEDRLHRIGSTVQGSVYSCIVIVAFLSLDFTLALLDLQRWEPFALSVFFVITTLLCFKSMSAPPRQPPWGRVT